MSRSRTNAEELRTSVLDSDIGTTVLAPNGSAANLTNLPASGSEDFVASGTLPNGATVILKSNGQVEVVTQTSAAISKSVPLGSETVFESTGETPDIDVAFDPNNANKFVVVFRQNAGYTNYPAAVVGTVSGGSLSFGTTVVLYSGNSTYTNIAFDPNTANKFVVSYRGVNLYGMSRVGTISGTALSFGSEDIISQGETNYISMAFDPNTAGKFVVIYRDDGLGDAGYARCGNVSGTDVTYGTAVVISTGQNNWKSIAFDPNNANKFVVVFEDGGNSNYGTGILGTLSGTNTISFGSEYVFNSGHTNYAKIAFDPNTAGKFVVAYQDSGNSGHGTSIIGKVAANGTITYGAEQVFNATDSDWISIDFDPNTANRFIVGFANWGNSGAASIVVGTISDLAISFSGISVVNTGSSRYISVAFDPNTAGKFVVAYRDDGNSRYGTAIVCQLSENPVTNMTVDNFLGISTAAYTNGQTATIMLQGGVVTNQSSLTIGSTYYVQPNGTLATSAAAPSVIAGKAVKATTLLLKGI